MFHSHAYLLRGSMYIMWRMDEKALKDLQAVLDTEGLSKAVVTGC